VKFFPVQSRKFDRHPKEFMALGTLLAHIRRQELLPRSVWSSDPLNIEGTPLVPLIRSADVNVEVA